MEEMNPRHQRFCEEWIQDMNGTRAYKTVYKNVSDDAARAGASRLMKNRQVQAYIQELMEADGSQRIAQGQEVLVFLTSVMRGEAQSDGAAPDIKTRVKCAELMGKRHKLFTDKVEAEMGNIQITIDDGLMDYAD